ncbi:unnamed protein product [Rotaria sp. Silwood2]|nr:unnamed protein product [Rotaria sp. Silwood2]CAF2971471.1 unnamed protein product [Rotaria sp. Silwood2]CAF3346404.1 unnamed protein product [Rotaria sp. Silwood2]CAF3370304.1 unnamed protein product [Rotaria sp. Silwood2]CAF4172415.1 unnamed protein product [Rotaria sp. Silwood2]
MNSFSSTSTNRNKVLEFATSRSPSNDKLTLILLEINVNMNYLTKPYADIRYISTLPVEEILFPLGSVFHINNASYDVKMNI